MSRAARTEFERLLREAYDMETRLAGELERMAQRVSDERVKKVLLSHIRITVRQQDRLKKVFSHIDKQPRRREAEPVVALVDRFRSMTSDDTPGSDVRAVSIAMQIEHAEIAYYKTLMALALAEGLKRSVSQFEKNLGEEEKAAQDLEDLFGTIGREPS
ncbi:MAG TPA: DUF892 family protein [Actinomycetota bacterium]|nr:DUF892 family protein [Actinomycetota bacterium]